MIEKVKGYVTLGSITGVLTFAGVLAGVFKLNGLSVFLADPNTALTVQNVIVGVLGLIAGVSQGVKKA